MNQPAQTPERMLALGSSMFPYVLSGSVLALQRVAAADLALGDIVVFVSPRGLCAHRLLQLSDGPSGKQLLVRGDAQPHTESVHEAALLFVVTHVAHRFLSYRTRSRFGRWLARRALQQGPGLPLAAAVLARLARYAPARPQRARAGVLQLSSGRPSLLPEGAVSARDSLLRGLKDELRTPLNAILGFADLLLGELDGPLDADARENVGVVRDAGGKLLGLINEVLDLATPLMAPSEPAYEEHDVIALLEEVRHELEQRRGVRPVHVRVEGAVSHLDARVDRHLLSRVLRALGDSALLATKAGGITLGVASQHDALDFWIAADGWDAQDAAALDPVELALGPARPHDRARRIAGMRIAIVARLLALQGASLRAARVLDSGALCVRLPLTAADPALRGAGPGEDAPSTDVSLALAYIAAMSHDLRTPLNAILGFADLLSMHKREAWSPAQRRSLEIVRERALDLAAMIDDTIDWAKLEAGELELKRELTDVTPIVERALAAATERSGARGLSLSLHKELQTDAKVWADASRCVQALLGLLDHAIRGNPGRQVQVRLQPTAAAVQIEIEDPGLLIREEDHTGVFDAFRPSYAPTGQRIAGLQLGPSVARSLFRAHGGDVWFESRPGRGTTFIATLPLATRAADLGQ